MAKKKVRGIHKSWMLVRTAFWRLYHEPKKVLQKPKRTGLILQATYVHGKRDGPHMPKSISKIPKNKVLNFIVQLTELRKFGTPQRRAEQIRQYILDALREFDKTHRTSINTH